MITFRHKGNFSKTRRYLERVKEAINLGFFDKYGREGVAALASATPIESGETAAAWDYQITHGKESITLSFTNSHVNAGVPIAIILQYGHGTGTGCRMIYKRYI